MNKLEKLVAATRNARPTAKEQEEQRRSFAYGNTHIENSRITRKTVDEEAERMQHPEDNLCI